jgi:hypothetical protein
MRLFRRFALLGVLLLMWFSPGKERPVLAQSCGTTDPNAFAGTCSGTKSDCLTSAAASRDACYGNCDTQYGSGTPADISCRNGCTNTYNTDSANCNTAYNNCMSQRQQGCYSICQSWCSGTTGAICSNYVDSYSGCAYDCGCYTPPPSGCPNPYCAGNPWQCPHPLLWMSMAKVLNSPPQTMGLV